MEVLWATFIKRSMMAPWLSKVKNRLKVIATDLVTSSASKAFILTSDKNHREIFELFNRADCCTNFEAIHHWHIDIKEHDINGISLRKASPERKKGSVVV